jgi:hypothetical protein
LDLIVISCIQIGYFELVSFFELGVDYFDIVDILIGGEIKPFAIITPKVGTTGCGYLFADWSSRALGYFDTIGGGTTVG